MNDWNAGDHTVWLEYLNDINRAHDPDHEVHVYIVNDNTEEHKYYFGWAKFFYYSAALGVWFECQPSSPDPCENNKWDKARVYINRYAFVNYYEPPAQPGVFNYVGYKRATAAHELGHAVNLAHELFSCDDGPCPNSIMSYNCIDPNVAPWWGSAITTVQPFDTCGVNHAYVDPYHDPPCY